MSLAEVVQGCEPTAFVDVTTGTTADRTLPWDFSIIDNTKHCLLIQTGQAVTWSGDFDVHPLAAQGGDSPNPIGTHQSGESATVTFNAVGTFGYKCLAHSPMIGAVKVVAATTTPAQAPALSPLVGSGLGVLLVAAGVALLRRRRTQVDVS